MEIISSIGTLIMLIILQVVLGFDNLLYISTSNVVVSFLEKTSLILENNISIITEKKLNFVMVEFQLQIYYL